MIKLKDLYPNQASFLKEKFVNEVSLPSSIKRHMTKLVDALKSAGLNRQKQLLVLAGVIDSLGVEPNQLMALIQKVKKGMNSENAI